MLRVLTLNLIKKIVTSFNLSCPTVNFPTINTYHTLISKKILNEKIQFFLSNYHEQLFFGT